MSRLKSQQSIELQNFNRLKKEDHFTCNLSIDTYSQCHVASQKRSFPCNSIAHWWNLSRFQNYVKSSSQRTFEEVWVGFLFIIFHKIICEEITLTIVQPFTVINGVVHVRNFQRFQGNPNYCSVQVLKNFHGHSAEVRVIVRVHNHMS